MLDNIAQTNLQLYNQLRHQDYSLDDLTLVHKAYELAKVLWSGRYRPNSKPILCHFVGVASLLGHLDMPAELIVVGLLHNAYGNADFGDGYRHKVTPRRRAQVRNTVGESIEGLLTRFNEFRILPSTLKKISRQIKHFDKTERQLVIVDFADRLEKYVDLGELYAADNQWVIGFDQVYRTELLDIAQQLDTPKLVDWLSETFDQMEQARSVIPDILRTTNRHDNPAFEDLIVPLSCRKRMWPRVVRASQLFDRWLRRRVRPYLHITAIKQTFFQD